MPTKRHPGASAARKAALTAVDNMAAVPARKAGSQTFTVDSLWSVARLGGLSLSPDGAQAVCTVGRHSMTDNNSRNALWLLSTLGGRPRELTRCGDKDGQARWSPAGDLIGFVSRREQEGSKDSASQFYVIPPDGGEARRIGGVATGITGWRWFPDGKRIALASWVWPELRGAKAQAARMQAERERKETGYATSEPLWRYWDDNLPPGCVVHLHTLDIATGTLRDLFEGTPYELRRMDPDADCFQISADGRRIVFAYDPAPVKQTDGRLALVELNLADRSFTTVVQDADWDTGTPVYSPDGQRIAFSASHQSLGYTMPYQAAVWERATGQWSVRSATWDHAVLAPMRWDASADPHGAGALLFASEEHGQQHLWRFDLTTNQAERVVRGGCVRAFDQVGEHIATLTDSLTHPAQAWIHPARPTQAPGQNAITARRMETFNDSLLNRHALPRHEQRWYTGALGDQVQIWLTFPPGFDPAQRYPLLHVIHGGPHTTAGDTWHYRWNATVFAAQGYVVAQVNYHGSTSFGHAFTASISQRWGELELQDIEAATDHLLAEPWIDPQRVFAAGGSYGGYLVAWMNGHVPAGRYAAYVCHAGCFDWTAMMAGDVYKGSARELGAWYWDDMARVNAQSPHAFAAHMHTPTLISHGARDYRVPDAQGLAFYHTLKARGVDARLLWFPDENHWIQKPRNAKLWHDEFLAWLKHHDAGARP